MKTFCNLSFIYIVFSIMITSCFAQSLKRVESEPSAVLRKELEEAEQKMWGKIMQLDSMYFREYVADDYIAINADGIMADKNETLADTARKRIFQSFRNATFKLLNKRIRVYGDVGIITGVSQVIMNDQVAVEFLYTGIFVKQAGRWMYTGWQGTMSRNSPVAPIK